MLRRIVLVAVLFLFSASAHAAMFGIGNEADSGNLPGSGEIEGIEPIGKPRKYRAQNFHEYYGTQGNRYIQYGMENMFVREYSYNGTENHITIEIANMENPTAAAGLFHYHRGQILGGKGKSVPVGTEGVSDTPRGDRNLYFYQSKTFVKIVYTGKLPIPDLLPIAQGVSAKLPDSDKGKPEGFELLEVEGVDAETISLTPGFTFNADFLPASVYASAPGGGNPEVSDIFLITRRTSKDAAGIAKDYTSFLRLMGENFEEYKKDGRRYVKAVDPKQGRVVFTAYKRFVIICARPDGYEKGEMMIGRVIDRIDAMGEGNKKR